jgi:hypothetical protein
VRRLPPGREGGEVRVAELDGDRAWAVRLSPLTLQYGWREARPMLGDRVRVAYEGERVSRKGVGYPVFSVEVVARGESA